MVLPTSYGYSKTEHFDFIEAGSDPKTGTEEGVLSFFEGHAYKWLKNSSLSESGVISISFLQRKNKRTDFFSFLS